MHFHASMCVSIYFLIYCRIKCHPIKASAANRDAITGFVLLAPKSAGGEGKVQEQQGTVAINRISQSHESFQRHL